MDNDNLGGMFAPHHSDRQLGFVPGDEDGPEEPRKPREPYPTAETVPADEIIDHPLPPGIVMVGEPAMVRSWDPGKTYEPTPQAEGVPAIAAFPLQLRDPDEAGIRPDGFTLLSGEKDQSAWMRSLKVGDEVGLVIEGAFAAERVHVSEIVTQEVNKQPGPFVAVDNGLLFDMQGRCVQPPRGVMMSVHHTALSLVPFTAQMRDANWRRDMLVALKDFNWGRLDNERLRQLEKLIREQSGI